VTKDPRKKTFEAPRKDSPATEGGTQEKGERGIVDWTSPAGQFDPQAEDRVTVLHRGWAGVIESLVEWPVTRVGEGKRAKGVKSMVGPLKSSHYGLTIGTPGDEGINANQKRNTMNVKVSLRTMEELRTYREVEKKRTTTQRLTKQKKRRIYGSRPGLLGVVCRTFSRSPGEKIRGGPGASWNLSPETQVLRRWWKEKKETFVNCFRNRRRAWEGPSRQKSA